MALTARTESGLKEVLESIGGAGDGHVVLAADLLAEGAPGRLVESIKEIGPIDMVVHVLGGALGMSDPLCDIEDWRKVWRLNIEVAVELNALLIPGMRKRGWGRNCAHLLGFGRREPWSSALLRREGGAQRVYAESRPHLRCRRRRDQCCGARRGYEPGGLLGHCAEGGLFPGQEIRGKEPADGTFRSARGCYRCHGPSLFGKSPAVLRLRDPRRRRFGQAIYVSIAISVLAYGKPPTKKRGVRFCRIKNGREGDLDEPSRL